MSTSIAERHQYILNKLREQGHVGVHELSQELKVSTVTIRKDLNYLEARDLLFRSHGSATPIDPYINERHVNEKEKIRIEQKQRIARFASGLITPRDSIFIGQGTTTLEFARQIKPIDQLTVVTPSLTVALSLSGNPKIDVIQLGGSIRRSSSSVVGHYAEKMMTDFTSSNFFLGVDGIDIEFGLTTTNNMEAEINKKMVNAARRVIVLADSTKFGRRGFARICDLSEIDMIITDSEVLDTFVKRIVDFGIEVKVV